MGRKAKEAATQKIGEWTNARRNTSKPTTKNENANASSNENRTPLQTHSQNDLNAMKNCSVRLERVRIETKTTPSADVLDKTPAKKVPAATDVTSKDKPAKKQNVYDFSFDADDTPGPMQETEDKMKDLFEKLAKDNIIEVKKYRPKNGKKIKADEKKPVKKVATQKRRREKQPVDVEPPQKKPNLKEKVVTVPTKSKATEVPSKGNGDAVRDQVRPANNENVNTQPRLRNRNFQHLQSTPKTSTPLGTKTNAMSKQNNGSLNSMFFDLASPLAGRSTRSNIQKQRLQLSAINDSQEDVPTKSMGQNENNENEPQFNFDDDDDDDFGFGNNAANGPEKDLEVDKENSMDRPSTSAQSRPTTSSAASNLWDQPSTSAAALRSTKITSNADKNRPGTSANVLRSLNQPSTSAGGLRSLRNPGNTASAFNGDKNQPGTSSGTLRSQDRPTTSLASSKLPTTSAQAAARTPLRTNNDNSVFEISSEYNIFSPTKRRVYGRSPLKNIVSFFTIEISMPFRFYIY